MLLIIQSRGKHPENREYRECECLSRAFTRQGIPNQVTGLGYESFAAFNELLAAATTVLVVENYGMTKWLPRTLRHFHGPRVFWCVDSHVAMNRHVQECDAYKFSMVLCSVAAHVNALKGPGRQARWCPNAYPSDLIQPVRRGEKRHDVGFCGSWVTGRRPFYEKVAKRARIQTDIRVLGDAMVEAVRSYRIHLNRNYSVDLNYRTYETMGAGTFLLTNPTDNLLNMFTPGVHLDVYRSVDECLKKIDYYLTHPHEREAIAANGCHQVQRKHSYDARARWMIEEGVVT